MESNGEEGGTVGVATMESDGTIVLQLRTPSDSGPLGEALFTYPTDHPEYQSVLDHLGGLSPGEAKPVPPWPDAPGLYS
jgi:hypothetical protein